MKCSIQASGGVLFCITVCLSSIGYGADWPTYLHDAARSGVTEEQLAPQLYEQWVYESRHAPRPAWPAPAKQDFWHDLRELKPVVTYDRAFHAVVADGALYFASSADDQAYCLDAATGKVRWSFFTGGPVRIAPSIADGKVYFGSDDGFVYCLAADDGRLIWKYRPDAQDRWIPGNGRVISFMPIRTGVLIDSGVAYFGAGLFSLQGVYRCALNADTGAVLWSLPTDNMSPQGYLLASPTRLFVPTGRTAPAMFDRSTGESLGNLEGSGGAYAILMDDAVASGPGRQTGSELVLADVNTKENIAMFPGIRIVMNGDIAYLQSKDKLSALNRTRYVALSKERNGFYARQRAAKEALDKKPDAAETERLNAEMAEVEKNIARLSGEMQACYLWEKRIDNPYSLILAGDVLFSGGEGKITALSTQDGTELWQGKVPGRAYGLSVASGNLFVSTDQGAIHCFGPRKIEREYVIKAADEPAPYPEDKLTPIYADAADAIVEETGITKGYCVVLGCGEGRLAYELAKRTDLIIVGIERDPEKVAAARKALNAAGLYGTRVTVRSWDNAALPYTTYMANLVVSDETAAEGTLPVNAREAWRIVQPFGGALCIGQPEKHAGRHTRLERAALDTWIDEGGLSARALRTKKGLWAVLERGAPPDAGEWTQLYATPGHVASSKDELRGPMAIQWFGEPGPRDIIDRHHRPMSSLFKDGRLFIPGDDLVITVDGYNGSPIWQLNIPNSRRIGALKNSGHMLVTDDYLYVAAEGECWAVNVADGTRAFTIPAPTPDGQPRDWGYLNCVDGLLCGTGQKPGASFDQFDNKTCNILEGDFRPVMISEYLFFVDRHTGEVLWTHKNGAIMNNAIAIDEGRVYFIESRNEKAMANTDGRIRIDDFLASDAHLVALHIKTGRKVWERPVTLPFHHILFLSGSKDTLIATGTFNVGSQVFYKMIAFDMDSGHDKWEQKFRALNIRATGFADVEGSHGEQWQHPVIIRDTIYLRPFAYDLATGKKLDYMVYRGGHGCGGLTGSAHYLYGRGDNPRMYPIETDRTDGAPLTRVSRPGCWLNIIPAGGIIMIPESSSGCTCGYPMQTSLALIPKSICGVP